ncbi:glutathione transferase GstA [Enterobacter kobei]|uniref:Glutathione transferase GstA n=2 Tax=Enterobacter kobei TaxID=208224 RepID=A0ACC8SBH3_9ENTR|nr:glutathione transferase GstA [Enterobacter kobei]OLR20859.1 glutathione transferase GstA [Enterobacter kobei]BCU55829.1 glutathione S-transferase [Enterobacter kobei]SIR75060.1 glutathione S-transferase [Enterobacter kobei]
MKLFYKPGACSLAPHIILRETGKAFTLEAVDLMTKRLGDGSDYLAINPKGQVPALQLDDGTLITEAVVIMQYLADSVPQKNLLAATGEMSRYKTLEWLNYIATELHKGFTPLFRPDTPDEYKPTVRGLLEKKLSFVNGELASREFIAGDHFTIADAYLYNVLRWARAIKLEMGSLSNIDAFMARVAARESVIATLAAEGL